MPPQRRAWALVLLIAWGEIALVLFAVLPPAGKVAALFLNGLPLGAVWGIVFSFLEGRRTSDDALVRLKAARAQAPRIGAAAPISSLDDDKELAAFKKAR